MKNIFLILAFFICTLPVYSQSNTLLEKYRNMALTYNHDLKAAEKNISISLELEKTARANLMPHLEAGANFQYTGNPAEITLNLPSSEKPLHFKGYDTQYGATLSLLQPLYTGKSILESIRLAQLGQTVSSNQAAMVRTAVCYQTDIQYWNTVARQEIVNVTTDFYKSMMALVTTIQERVDAGLIDPQELLMAEVKLNEAKYQLLQAKNSFKTGLMAFNSLIGNTLETSTEIDQTIPVIIMPDSLQYKNGANRPEIKIAETQIKIAESNLQLTDSRYKPQLYIGLDGSYSSPGYNFNKDLDWNYAAYAKLSIPIFNGGKRRSEKRTSSQQIGIATDKLNKIEDQITLEVATAKTALQQALDQVTLSENSLGKANENEQKALERYHEGKISTLEVIDAQTYRQTSQLNYVEAKVSAQYQYSALIKALNAYEQPQ